MAAALANLARLLASAGEESAELLRGDEEIADLVTVQRAAGHSDPKITEQHYIGADAERMRAAARKLSFGGTK